MGRTRIYGLDPDQVGRLLSLGIDGAAGERAAGPEPTAAGQVDPEHPGAWIGRYRLLTILGEGGMGTVYLAEQEGAIKRQVALKVIKPGMDSKRVIARFEAERQTLALLDHPHIAQVYDAGTTESGRPYFVMEHVKGLPVTEYCDRYKLSIDERLRLFQQVCLAVHHAHQKGIIHRDIKPSNILVSAENDQPIPKIIDFGVAKAISQPLTDRTLFTEDSQLLGTPEYMSPEQAEMVNEDIDTRSDIYSLGVLLYVLLAGILPYDSETFHEGGIEHIRKVIRDTDPKTPSTRLTKLGEEAKKLAEDRRTDAATLAKRLHAELEWIPLKAMRKERAERYRSASELADDIENYLKAVPLMAGPLTAGYRLQKFLRRHRGVLAAAAVVAVVLVLGASVSTWQAVRATAARRAETAQRRKAEALAYASDMSLAQQALARDDMGRAWRLLDAHRPAPGELDLRGWEWRYLWQECRGNALSELCRYPNSARSVAYSPDGKMLAVAGYEQGFVDVWDVPSRKRIALLLPKEGHFVTFSPRGDLLATGAGNQIQLWRTGSWSLVRQLDLADRVQVLTFSPDGSRLACLSWPDEVAVWEVDQWTVVRQIRGVRPAGYHIGTLDFSPDGKALAIGDADHRLQVIDLASGNKNLDIPEAHPERITAVAWSPNGSIIASGSGYSGGPIRLWNAASGESLGALEGHTSWISELIFDANSAWLYSAGADQTIRIWDVGAQQPLATLRGSRDEVYGLALSPDGTMLASVCKDGVVAFWSALPRPEEKFPKLSESGRFDPGAFAPDSRVLAVPREGTVSLFDLATLREVEQLPLLGSDVWVVTYSPDGTLLVSGSESGKVRVWSCAERRLLRELDGHNQPILLLRFRVDGTRLFSRDAKGKAIWWDTLAWQAVQTFVIELPINTWNVSPDGRLGAVGTYEGVVHWLNAETGEVLATRSDAHRQKVTGIAFSADGMQAASVAADGTLAIWDPSSFQLITAFKGHMAAGQWVAFSPDGRRLATSSVPHEIVKLWDPSTHRELMTLPGQGSVFASVDFSPDGNLVLATNTYGRLHLWRAPSWAEIEAEEKKPENRQSP